MGWRENGEGLRKSWRDLALEGIKRDIPPQLMELMESLSEPGTGAAWTISRRSKGLSDEFVKALEASSDRDMTPLAEYLETDKPLSREERKALARRLPKRATGRPKNSQLRTAATVAWMFYKEGRDVNKKLRVSDHGHCNDMKGYAAQWMVEDWFAWGGGGEELTEDNRSDFAAGVRELMEKPKHLRDGCERGLIAFPVFGWESKTTKTKG